MTNLPLPLPATDAVRGEQPAADIGGVILRHRCADEVAAGARPVIERYRQYLESGADLEGLQTRVGFSIYRLRQSGPSEYWVTVCDYSADDLVETTTDDLTFALWIDLAQAETVAQAGVAGEEVDLANGLQVTKAALTVLDKGRPDELVVERRTPSETDSGWLVRTAERSYLRNKQVEIIAGHLATIAPYLLPHLTLPTGTVVRVAEGRCLEVTVPDTAQPAAMPDVPMETLTATIGGQTLTAKGAAHLAPLLQGVLDEFAAAGQVAVGSRVSSGYADFCVEEGEGGTLRVMSADFTSPQDYVDGASDDLSVPLSTQVVQAFTVKEAGVGGQETRANHSIAIQAAALEDIVLERPVALLMERMGHEDGRDVLANGTRRSGWWITKPVPDLTDEQISIRNIDAGELQAAAPGIAQYYCLPEGTMLQFVAGQLASAHLVDHAKLTEIAEREPHRTMGELLASDEVATRLPIQ